MSNNKILMAEINTWVWLRELERKYARHMTLDRVPPNEWDEFAELGFNAIWLMGIWRRSPEGRRLSRENESLFEEYSESLPDWKRADFPGSPYCVKEYLVDARYGGIVSLEKVHKDLNQRGIRLILDFVPNHVAIDHIWLDNHPEYFIRGDEADIVRSPTEFFRSDDGIFANGRDPFNPPWPDVAQVNAFSPEYRDEVIQELKKIGRICDGVRCDMTMLLLNEIFAHTWQSRVGVAPETEFWEEIITEVKKVHPAMTFFAEVYWGLESELLQVGFDYCYDKRLYDRLMNESAATIKQHIEADFEFQKHLLHFIENHDESRAASLLPVQRQKAASILAFTLPGASLLYEGQWEGRKLKNHVLLGRRQPERINKELLGFYKNLLPAIKGLHDNGSWQLCKVTGWSNNQTCENLLVYTWQAGSYKDLIIVNFSDEQSQGRAALPWPELRDVDVKFTDVLEHETLVRSGSELKSKGFFVDIPPWGYYFLSTYLR
ncbi:MAG: alpha-amylase family glycosyl hydrolase [Leptolinea sp.]